MKNSNRKTLRFFAALAIWMIMTGIWGFVWYKYYSHAILVPFFRRGNWVVVAIYGFLLLLITSFYGGYRVGFYRRGDILFSGLLSITITNAITYLQTSLIGRMFMNVVPFLWMTVIDVILFWIWATLADKLYQKLNPPRELLCVYGGSSLARSMILKIADRDDKYILREACNIDEGAMAVFEKIDRFNSVLICDVKSSYRNRILKYCYEKGIRVYLMPKISDILIRGANQINLFDSPLLLSRNDGLSFEQLFLKRALDITLSLLGLALGSIFMLFSAAAIKLYDGGAVIYSQTRLTEGGRVFKLYKFRSMIVNAESKNGAQLASQNDSRVTPVGRLLRKIRFDELPQLINILKGDMSIVGPRPERPEIAEVYKKEMPEFDFRLKVKAGLTGYAQVLGKYNTTPYDKLKLDLIYISSYSFLLDIKLILMTIKIVFMKESTEGVTDGNKE